jgi:large subunit ribosomal protein L9
MEIILVQDIPGLGHRDQIINVKDGYAINYLIPKGYAIQATPSAKKQLQEKLRQRAKKEEKLRNEALNLKEKIESKEFVIEMKASESGKIFGSVTNALLHEKLEQEGIKVDRKQIEVAHIKELGKFTAKVHLYKDVVAEMRFEVVAEK